MRMPALRKLSASPLLLMSIAFGTAMVSGLLTLAADAPARTQSSSAPIANRQVDSTTETRAAALQYGKLPLRFEKNQGQTATAVQYLTRGAGYSVFLAGNEAVLSLRSLASSSATSTKGDDGLARLATPAVTGQVTTTWVVRAQLVGANADASVAGESALPGHSNYLTGKAPGNWHAAVAQFARVHYRDIYDGIDLVYYGNQQQLEYDFIVKPGARPDTIRLRYRGIDSASVDATGNLHLRSAGDDLIEHKPVIYQLASGGRRAIDGSFHIIRRPQTIEVAFEVGDYDRTQPLVIDPVLSYAGFLGGSNDEQGLAIAVDSHGAAYVTGVTGSTDFPTTSGAGQSTFGGNSDAFVSKISADGSTLVYSTYLGGSQADAGFGIAVDNSGEAYVTGTTTSVDFPTTAGALQASLAGAQDAFVSKLSADGGSLVYSTYLGGTNSEQTHSIAVDSSGEAYIAGYTGSNDFPTTASAFQTVFSGSADAFVSKLSSDGSHLVYSTYIAGTSSQQAYGIAIDSAGAAYITGETDSADFPITAGAYQTTLGGSSDAFVSKLAANGRSLAYSSYLGGFGSDLGEGIAVDSHGSAYVTGYTLAGGFPTTPGSFQPTATNNQTGFVTKFSADGSSVVYSSFLGGTLAQISESIVVDSTGAAYVTGPTNSVDFPTVGTQFQSAPTAPIFSYVTKISADGSSLIYSALLGGSTLDWTDGIALSPGGSAYVTGYTQSADFPATSGALGTALGGFEDALVAKVTQITVSPSTLDFGNAPIGVASAAQTVTISNGSNDDVMINSIISGNAVFIPVSHCGDTITGGTSCTIDVQFMPDSFGVTSGTLTITTSAATLTVSLSGTGIAVPVASASTPALDLGTTMNSKPTMATVVLTDVGASPLTIKSIAASPGFGQASNCGPSLMPGGQCTITVTFQPTHLGVSNGDLTVSSNSALGAIQVALTGNNVQAPPANNGDSSGGGAVGGDVLSVLTLMASLRRRFATRSGSDRGRQ